MRGVILSRHRLISTSLLIQQRYTGLLFADFATRVRGSGFAASGFNGSKGRGGLSSLVRVTGAAIGLALLHEASDGNMVRDHHWRRFMPLRQSHPRV